MQKNTPLIESRCRSAEIRWHALLPGGALVCCFPQSLDSVVQLLYPLPLIRVRLPTFLMFGLELVQHCQQPALSGRERTAECGY